MYAEVLFSYIAVFLFKVTILFRFIAIHIKIYYNREHSKIFHQTFIDNTNKKQSVYLSIIPENDYKKIEYIAFSFLYAYNENEIKAYNAMRNISSNGYVAEETSSDSTTTEEESDTKPKEMITILII